MIPTPQQREVIDSKASDILVEAGAGSGKTTTTVARYVRLLEDGHEPREILAFTFTDKAAGELREKVRDGRRRLAETAAAEAGGSSPEAVSMSEAWVGTFHAICLRILKAYPIEAGVDPGFSVIDDVTAETVKSDAFSEALEKFRREDPDPDSRDELVGVYTENGLRDTIRSAWGKLRSRGIPDPRLPEFEDTEYPAAMIADIRTEAAELVADGSLHSSPRGKLEALIELLDQAGPDILTFDQLSPHAFKSTVEAVQEIQEKLRRVIADLAAIDRGDRVRRDLGRLLELYGERYSEKKAERSVLDYEDLQLLALRLLLENEPIRAAYRERFKEIMVDEFQDTNQLQLNLVNALRGEETTLTTVGDEMQSIYGFRHADVELFRNRRRDDSVTVLGLTDNFRSTPEVIDAVNELGRRLDRQVEKKRGGDDSRDSDDSRHEFTDLTFPEGDKPAEPGSATILVTDPTGWKGLDLGPMARAIPAEADVGKEEDHYHEAEALNLARHLREMVDEGEAEQGDITILLRARTRSELYVSALREVGLSPYLVGGAGFWKTREAVEMRALLCVIANPLDDESLIATLTSPACGLSTDALWILNHADPGYNPLWPALESLGPAEPPTELNQELMAELTPADRAIATGFVSTVNHLRGISAIAPLDELIDEAVTATGYDLANLVRDPSRNGLANLRRLSSLGHEYELSQGRDLRGFLDWAKLSAELESEASVATQEEESDVIRIMTVHAAKGLEFKVVCVPECSRINSNRQDTPLALGRSLDPENPMDFKVGLKLKSIDAEDAELYDWVELKEDAGRATEDEELRLFHVALTRSEQHLVVSGVGTAKLKGEVSDSRPMIDRIQETFELDPGDSEGWPETVPAGDDESGGKGPARVRVNRNRPTEKQAERLRAERDPLEAEVPVRVGAPPLHRPESRILPSVPLSFSALNLFMECPSRFYARRILRLEEPSAAGRPVAEPDQSVNGLDGDPALQKTNARDHGTAFGSAVHDVLEQLGKSKWPEATGDQIARALRRRGADPETDLGRASGMIEHFLESDLGRRIRNSGAGFEIPLLMRIENTTIRGYVDVLVNSDPPLVLDYKTNILGVQSPAEKMEDYRQQRNLYSLAVARSRSIDRVESAFVFLEDPDQPVIEMFDSAGLERAEAELSEALRDFTRGQFFGGPGASVNPCGECWACEYLAAQRNSAAEAA
ncbi:MAG: UvrD-helicase domain-containing protein [Thermoleophilia bacterium]|nr:UvrD-helicase domain-containing protein [Thermoleophilia bacterium]